VAVSEEEREEKREAVSFCLREKRERERERVERVGVVVWIKT